MRRLILFVGVFVLGMGAVSAQELEQVLQGRKAHEVVPGASVLRYKAHTAVPNYIKFQAGQEIPFSEFENFVLQFLEDANGYTLNLTNSDNDQLGMTHFRYQLAYQGTPIEFATYLAHTRNGLIVSVNGEMPAKVEQASAGLDEAQALTGALEQIGASLYKWDLLGEEEHLKWETNDPYATYYPTGELVYFPDNADPKTGNYRLAWKFNIYAHQPISRADVYVDAETGQILFRNEQIHTADVIGTAVTGFSGQQTITADSFGGGFRLRESGRGNGIETFDMNLTTSYANSVDFTDSDNFWDNANASYDEFATDAHWGTEVTYDYLFIEHGRNSIDGNGFALRSYIHADLVGFGLGSNVNAFWDGSRMTYGDGNPPTVFPLTAIDITGHEIAHGLTNNTSNLIYQNESGALNESFSDIFGTAIEFYGLNSGADWLIGEDIGFALRSMSSPNAAGDPDTYFGTNWFTGTADNGGVHINSGVQNYWFYLLTEGGSGTNDLGNAFNVNSIGISDAGAIAFRNNVIYLTQSSDYSDARFYALESAIDLFGTCSPQLESAHNAWYAVGIGNPYVPTVNADFVADPTQSCVAPVNVTFVNLSSNASSYTWDFGDGSFSGNPSPSHVYTNYGTYDVTLAIDGGACGTDTLEIPNYIVADQNLPCVVTLQESGLMATQTSCTGKFYDPGGGLNPYPSDASVTMTIAPIGASTVTLDFVNFNVQPGNGVGCNQDALLVYDGATVISPLLGSYCNSNPPPASLTSTGNAVTIVFASNGSVNLEGFEIDWQCNQPVIPPVTDFVADNESTCSGTVQFTDLSTEGPTSWSWDFGDGNNSTLQNPLHTYQVEGLYEVTLTTTNAIGTSTEIKTDYIDFQRPAGPVGTNEEICPGESATLTSIGNGPTYWYNDTTGSGPFYVGDTLVTPVLQASQTYYTVSKASNPSTDVGAPHIGIGGGDYFNNPNQYLIFDTYRDVEIVSVRVWSDQAADRTIQLRDNNGAVLDQITVNIPFGIQQVALGFEVPVGTNYQLGLAPGSTVGLYRNNSGPNYPYTAAGLLEITQSSANNQPFDFYYFFYDWEVREQDCRSNWVEVIADMSICTGVDEIEAVTDLSIFPNPTRGLWSLNATLDQTEDLSIGLYDLKGQLIRTLYQSNLPAGSHQLDFDLTGQAQGIYQVRVETARGVQTRKLVLMQ